MKSILTAFVLIVLGVIFSSDSVQAQSTNPRSESSKNLAFTQLSPTPIDHDPYVRGARLHPRLGGVFVDGATYGTQLINPLAPAKFGQGEKYATAPMGGFGTRFFDGPTGLRSQERVSGDDRKSGGIKLFSFEF